MLVVSRSRKPSGLTCQKPMGSVMKCGFTVRMPIPALLTSTLMPPSLVSARSTPAVTGILVADVHDQAGHLVAAGDPGDGVLDAGLGPAGEGDAGTGFGQGLAHGEAQAAGTPGHERADSFEIWRRFGHAADPTPARPRARRAGRTAHTAR